MKKLFSLLIISIISTNLFCENRVHFTITTPQGEMKGVLYNETPLHRDNFTKLIASGFYNDLLFHRVIKDFMIQGGDPESRNALPGTMLGTGGPGYTIPAEFNTLLFHKKGALAAARTGDAVNPQKASSGSQFYIVQGRVTPQKELDMLKKHTNKKFAPGAEEVYATLGGTPFLDDNYTVFGEITEGLPVIDAIANQQADKNNRPIENISFQISLDREKSEEAIYAAAKNGSIDMQKIFPELYPASKHVKEIKKLVKKNKK